MNSEVELKHGKLYDCASYCGGTVERQSIVQLAIDTKSNCRWVLLNARRLYELDPRRVHELIKMSFGDLLSSDFNTSDIDWSGMIFTCSLTSDGSLEDYNGDDLLTSPRQT